MSLRGLVSVHTVTIQRESITRGSMGAPVRTWAARHTNVGCRVQPLSAREAAALLKDGMRVSHRVYFDTDYGIDERDRIVFNTRKLQVVGARNTDELDRLWAVDCEERKDAGD